MAVKDILSDTEIRVSGLPEDTEISTPSGFKIVPKIDQSQVFSKVWQALKKGECIGIFPEVRLTFFIMIFIESIGRFT